MDCDSPSCAGTAAHRSEAPPTVARGSMQGECPSFDGAYAGSNAATKRFSVLVTLHQRFRIYILNTAKV